MRGGEFEEFLAVNFRGEKARLSGLCDWFYETVRSSERFSGIAVGQVKDELKRSRIVLLDDMKSRYGTKVHDPKPTLLYEEDFSLPALSGKSL